MNPECQYIKHYDWCNLSGNPCFKDTGGCEEYNELLKGDKMGVIPSETIYSDGDVIIPMADVQHIEKRTYQDGTPSGILVITKHTRWDMDADCWANNVWIDREKAEGFIRAWCYFRYEVDGIRAQMESLGAMK